MPKMTLKDGVLTAEVYVQVTRDYVCSCGQNITVTLDWPEGLTVNGPVNINKNCPACNEAIVIPAGKHYIENYKLLTK